MVAFSQGPKSVLLLISACRSARLKKSRKCMVLARLRSTNEKQLLGNEHKNHMSRKTGAKSFQVKDNIERDLQIAFFRFPK